MTQDHTTNYTVGPDGHPQPIDVAELQGITDFTLGLLRPGWKVVRLDEKTQTLTVCNGRALKAKWFTIGFGVATVAYWIALVVLT